MMASTTRHLMARAAARRATLPPTVQRRLDMDCFDICVLLLGRLWPQTPEESITWRVMPCRCGGDDAPAKKRPGQHVRFVAYIKLLRHAQRHPRLPRTAHGCSSSRHRSARICAKLALALGAQCAIGAALPRVTLRKTRVWGTAASEISASGTSAAFNALALVGSS
jgi:hypothetical protein